MIDPCSLVSSGLTHMVAACGRHNTSRSASVFLAWVVWFMTLIPLALAPALTLTLTLALDDSVQYIPCS
jgi:hypothetical protein